MKYICELCGHIYDEDQGDPRHGIAPGTVFAQLPEHYECPECYSEKHAFSLLGHKQTLTAPQAIPGVPSLPPKQESER